MLGFFKVRLRRFKPLVWVWPAKPAKPAKPHEVGFMHLAFLGA